MRYLKEYLFSVYSTLNLISPFPSKCQDKIDVKPYIYGFTLDAICKTTFGLETTCYKLEKNEISKICESVVDDFDVQGAIGSFLTNLIAHFPNLMTLFGFWPDSALKLGQLTHDIIEERTKKNVEMGDFIDRLKEHKENLGKDYQNCN